ncbi:MAG: dihydroorotate dehydrogenase electron transfer subunit [Christensenellaceae bacterium]|jgi:dihydroorotate dehydrogenase electron transfer subunit|nr:dihydroorotate dehydrogenase electron transfer subunit [Christensenellaceae bacterium]
MAVILENQEVGAQCHLVTLRGVTAGHAGQFVMVRIPGTLDPLLGRPITLFDVEGDVTRLLMRSVGRVTAMIKEMQALRELEVEGPYGNGFPLLDSDITLIGGGIGIAPLYLLAKEHRALYPHRRIRIYLGFKEAVILEKPYAAVADEVRVKIGGAITDDIDYSVDDIFYACGPTNMMRVIAQCAKERERKAFVSLENRMACGAGACLGCTQKTASGNKRACKDGPVFPAEEVFYE